MKLIVNLKNMLRRVYQINQTKVISIPFIHNMCVIKARTHGCLRNDRETHSTGVTGLHSRLCRSCDPVTQSRAFHCHFAHTRAFSLYKLINRISIPDNTKSKCNLLQVEILIGRHGHVSTGIMLCIMRWPIKISPIYRIHIASEIQMSYMTSF